MKKILSTACVLAAAARLGAQTPTATPARPQPAPPPAPTAPARPSAPAAPVPAPSGAPLAPATDPAGAQEIPLDRVVAVVGDHPVLWSDVLEAINQRRAQGLTVPTDSAAQLALARRVVNELVDEEVLVHQAAAEKVEVTDDDVSSSVEQQITRVRGQFKTEQEFRDELKRAGFGSPEDYRRSLMDQARRSALQQRVVEKMRQDGKLLPASVSEADVSRAFETNRATLPKRPATVTFRQIVVAPRPSAQARATARAKAESLLVEIRKGGDFEQIAKRESMDQTTRETGGDLGWNRRGVMVPEFERMMFSLAPGRVSPVVETSFGFHIIRVDRVQPAEVKARHILIRPRVDSANVSAARAEADSVARLWRAGGSFDSLAARHHDPREEKVIPQPFERSQLPPAYGKAFEGKKTNDITDPFPIEDKQSGVPKFVVAQVLNASEGGDYTVADLRNQIREQLQQERSFRRLLDALRKDVYVSVRL